MLQHKIVYMSFVAFDTLSKKVKKAVLCHKKWVFVHGTAFYIVLKDYELNNNNWTSIMSFPQVKRVRD